MLRKIYLFGSVGLHALAIGPHIYARIIRSPLSTPGFRLRDQSCLSLTGDLNFRGGSNVDANTVSDSSYDDSEALSGDGFDADEGDSYSDPFEHHGSYGDILEPERSSGLNTDSQYFMPSSVQLYVTFGCMILGRRIDFFKPTFVRLVRFTFVFQILIQQFFLLYVRLVAKRTGDKSKVDASNPAINMLLSQLQLDGSAQEIAKKLTSSILSSDMTVMEYDLKQGSDIQGGVVANMLFMWLLHFKLEKIQPLLIQVLMGFLQLAYSPLFQVYVLRRNLKRPFKNPNVAAWPSMTDSCVVTPEEQVGEAYSK